MEQTFKILSLDGGGMKGLYAARILQEFEAAYGPVHRYFHMICGTSTGGILALALSTGIPAATIVQFYERYGPKIFPYQRPWWRLLHMFKQLVIRSKYSDRQLRAALEDVFGERKVKDCHTIVLVPATNITTGEPTVFKSNHTARHPRDMEAKLVEVALATAAAPTFFPVASVQVLPGEQFVDGGLWANNPALVGIQEASDYYFNKGYERIGLLSIPTAHERTQMERTTNTRLSFLKWRDKLISMMIDAQSKAVENHIRLLLKSGLLKLDYLRLPDMLLSAEEREQIELDLASPRALHVLHDAGRATGRHLVESAEVQVFFAAEVERVEVSVS